MRQNKKKPIRHPILNWYFKGLGLLGIIGFLSNSWNIYIQPEIAPIIQPVFYVVAILHAVFLAHSLLRQLSAEKPPSNLEREKRIFTTGVIGAFLAVLFANAFMRGIPLISTYLWSQPQLITAHIAQVKDVKRLSKTCGWLLVSGSGRTAQKITLKEFYWPNKILCVGSYAAMLPQGKDYNSTEGTVLLMAGYGNALGFRMDEKARYLITPAALN